jgi:hypothetical protein
MLEIIRQKYYGLEVGHRQEVGQPTALRKLFLKETAKELSILSEEAEAYLNMVVAADNHDVAAIIDMMGLDNDSVHHLSGLERERQFVDWHNEMVLLPQAESLIIRGRMENGMSYHEARNLDIDPEELRRTMHTIISKQIYFFPRPNGDVEEEDKKASLLIVDIPQALANASRGMTKTQILKELGKDNPSWRGKADEVLEYLCLTQKIRLVGKNYYHIERAPKIYETEIHRRVYEAVLTGNRSVSAIAKAIKYDNTRGRKRVQTILNLLEQENLIQSNDNNTYQRWSITN